MNTTAKSLAAGVRPRVEGEPEVDLTMFGIVHRAMRAETRRLAELTAAQGDTPFPAAREAALQKHLGFLAHEIHHHHTKEDTVLWPVIVASAGAAIDLAPLTDDHGAIDPYLDAIRTTRGTARARALADLCELLDEHIGEEEASVFPIMRRYVSAEDWEVTEKSFQKGSSPAFMKWVLPYLFSHAAGEEREQVVKKAGLPIRIMLRLFRPSYERLQIAVYGA